MTPYSFDGIRSRIHKWPNLNDVKSSDILKDALQQQFKGHAVPMA
jgi:hypothetical protein